FVFAGGATASAGAAAGMLVRGRDARAARMVTVFGAVLELAAAAAMERRLGGHARAYREGRAARASRAARALTLAGAALPAGRVGRGHLLVGVWRAARAPPRGPLHASRQTSANAVARSTASSRLLAPSLVSRCRTWNSTVFSLTWRACAMSRLRSPRQSRSSTSSSRRVGLGAGTARRDSSRW